MVHEAFTPEQFSPLDSEASGGDEVHPVNAPPQTFETIDLDIGVRYIPGPGRILVREEYKLALADLIHSTIKHVYNCVAVQGSPGLGES